MDFPEENMIDKWLEENGNPEIEIQVLNEVIDVLEKEIKHLLKQRDEFAIEFADWLNINYFQIVGNKTWCKTLSMENEYTSKELLEIFKKEKGL